jgi:hypothetical protein
MKVAQEPLARARAADGGGSVREPVDRAFPQNQVSASLCERPREGDPEAAGRASDHGNLVVESEQSVIVILLSACA